jgi:hypothetical protein
MTAANGHRALAVRLGARSGQVALQHFGDEPSERLRGRHARDLLGHGVPEDDAVVPVDRDDAVGDVGEDRLAPLLLLGNALVELGVRDRGCCGRRQRHERLHLVVAPGARLLRVHGQDPVEPSTVRLQRDGDARRHRALEQRVAAGEAAFPARILGRERRA